MTQELREFQVGKVYFSMYFHDQPLRLPDIETLVYLGRHAVYSDLDVHAFQTAYSYSRDGFWNGLSSADQNRLSDAVRFFRLDSTDPICDYERLLVELQDWRRRTSERAAA